MPIKRSFADSLLILFLSAKFGSEEIYSHYYFYLKRSARESLDKNKFLEPLIVLLCDVNFFSRFNQTKSFLTEKKIWFLSFWAKGRGDSGECPVAKTYFWNLVNYFLAFFINWTAKNVAIGTAKTNPILPVKVLTISVAIISLSTTWLKVKKGGCLTLNKISSGKEAPA